ncbi:fructose-bisphosphatase class II family protein [Amycolatopsis jiangsuensis]|uniref:Fructose-1,6-bisphosphatase n=1 Tax=Amycolatopsis jiangsuensis TaxID=1181879 RepID=A0A840IZT1_9PSEU|nr:fructose-bisphosphatase class II family protein [Amycolatopsis jiangsuensis]MBB4686915.1 fructose-1,6-bisphosphatase II [Amycolatopsis jiangsuensis]
MKAKEWGISGAAGGLRVDERDAGTDGPGDGLALELVRVTEAAAIAAGRWAGHGDEEGGRAAADVMHELIRSVPMRGVVVIGRGTERDTPVLFNGETAGDGTGPACDIGISVGDGVLSAAGDVPNALAAIAVAEPGALYDPSPVLAMEKLAVGPDYVDVVDIRLPVADNLRAVARAGDAQVSDLVVAVLNRPRHRRLVHEIRDAGARVHLIEGGDVAGAIAAARPESPVDLMLGTGGSAEGVVAAAALSCLGGSLQARLRSETPGPAETGFGEVLHTGDLVRGENVVFCATGVTGNEVLRGVQHHSGRTTTQSMVMCAKANTVRIVTSEHRPSGGTRSTGPYDG